MLLMTITTKLLSPVSAGVTRVALFVIQPAVLIVKALSHRREVMRLGELDERGLKDIGLVRSDLDGALAVSWLSDPSVVLAERSSARSGVAAVRRETALQQAAMADATARSAEPARPTAQRQAGALNSVACSA